jgi:hypothetical protein
LYRRKPYWTRVSRIPSCESLMICGQTVQCLPKALLGKAFAIVSLHNGSQSMAHYHRILWGQICPKKPIESRYMASKRIDYTLAYA